MSFDGEAWTEYVPLDLIAEAMAKTKDLPVAGGKLTYDDKHNPIVPALIIEVKDGKPTFVDKISF